MVAPPVAPEEPVEPPTFDPRDLPDANDPEKERWQDTPGIQDPLKAVMPVSTPPVIQKVFPHAACMHGGCSLTIWGTDLFVETVEFDKTKVFVGGVPCVDVVGEEVMPDCSVAEKDAKKGSAHTGGSGNSAGNTPNVFVELDAFSSVVPASLLDLRAQQHQAALRQRRRHGQTQSGGAHSRRAMETYVGNRVVSPFIPPARERIEFQRRAMDQMGIFSEPRNRVDVLSPAVNPAVAYNNFGGNFPVAVPNNWQYPPFVAKPPQLPATTAEETQPGTDSNGPPGSGRAIAPTGSSDGGSGSDENTDTKLPTTGPPPPGGFDCSNGKMQALTCTLTDARKLAACGPTDIVVVSKERGRSAHTQATKETYFEYRCIQRPTLVSATPMTGPAAKSGLEIELELRGAVGTVTSVQVGHTPCEIVGGEISKGSQHQRGAMQPSMQPAKHPFLKTLAAQEAGAERDPDKMHLVHMMSFLEQQLLLYRPGPDQMSAHPSDDEKAETGKTLKWNDAAACEEPCLLPTKVRCVLRCCCCPCVLDKPQRIIVGTSTWTQKAVFNQSVTFTFEGPCGSSTRDNGCEDCPAINVSPSPSSSNGSPSPSSSNGSTPLVPIPPVPVRPVGVPGRPNIPPGTPMPPTLPQRPPQLPPRLPPRRPPQQPPQQPPQHPIRPLGVPGRPNVPPRLPVSAPPTGPIPSTSFA